MTTIQPILDHFWPIFNWFLFDHFLSCSNQFLPILEKFGQLSTIFRTNFDQFWQTFNYSIQLLTSFDPFQPILTRFQQICNQSWPILDQFQPTFNQVLPIADQLWAILTNFRLFFLPTFEQFWPFSAKFWLFLINFQPFLTTYQPIPNSLNYFWSFSSNYLLFDEFSTSFERCRSALTSFDQFSTIFPPISDLFRPFVTIF